ncbi:MAG TPA: nitrilase-related carbon-nitrogen hydrolase [Syntrophales bacterium]|jgi:predicted amidohydrolase|nr:nitrilase-related carbon-nitrogen hydrolase [Syntrophales bacterium]HRT62075.1 nitrilase-related carbon-nitrogen hydrolase [Syntrophales bacterium]
MKIGYLQFDPAFGQVDRNLDKVVALIENAGADLLVLPELFNTGYLFTSLKEARDLAEEVPGGRTTEALVRAAKKNGIHIVGGLAERSGDKIYNSAVLVSPDGFVAVYRKIHLFFEEKLWFSPGDRKPAVYDIGACRVGVMICFDWFFPEMTRILALQGADVICHSANLVLPYCQDVMITRCLENRVFAVTCNRTGSEQRGGKTLAYTGRSQIVDPRGNVLFRAGRETEEIRVADVDVKAARDKQLNEHNNLFADRRPRFYGALVGEPEGG